MDEEERQLKASDDLIVENWKKIINGDKFELI